MKKTILKAILIFLGVGLVLLMGFIIFIFMAFPSSNEKDYSVTDLVTNFNNKKQEIYELKRYFREIVPQNRVVEIEFKDNNTLSRFGFQSTDEHFIPIFLEWDLKIDAFRTDSIIRTLGWTRETLKTLKEKLDNADCIQIESGEPTKIGFKRFLMGMYFFNVFDEPIPDSLRSHYNDSCMYIYANNKLVLEFQGGTIGNQCFYNMK